MLFRDHTLQTEARAYLDEGEGRSRQQRLVLVFHLMSHVLLHSLLIVDLPFSHHVEEGARGDCDGDSVLRFGLREDGHARKTLNTEW